MIQRRSRGVALILVISLMGMMAITFVYLARSCWQIFLQTERQYASNLEMNLVASGLSWASLTGQTNGPVVLDVNLIAGHHAELAVEVTDSDPNEVYVHIHTSIQHSGTIRQAHSTFRIRPS